MFLEDCFSFCVEEGEWIRVGFKELDDGGLLWSVCYGDRVKWMNVVWCWVGCWEREDRIIFNFLFGVIYWIY